MKASYFLRESHVATAYPLHCKTPITYTSSEENYPVHPESTCIANEILISHRYDCEIGYKLLSGCLESHSHQEASSKDDSTYFSSIRSSSKKRHRVVRSSKGSAEHGAATGSHYDSGGGADDGARVAVVVLGRKGKGGSRHHGGRGSIGHGGDVMIHLG